MTTPIDPRSDADRPAYVAEPACAPGSSDYELDEEDLALLDARRGRGDRRGAGRPAAGARHRRPPERRQVHARQPHPRPPRGRRRGHARRHPRPRRLRGRAGPAAGSPSSTPAAGSPTPTGIDASRRRAGRGRDRARRRGDLRRRRHRRRDRHRRARRASCCARPASRWCSWPTRSTTPRSEADAADAVVLGPRRAVPGLGAARPRQRRPARRRASTVLPEVSRRRRDAESAARAASRSSAARTSASPAC